MRRAPSARALTQPRLPRDRRDPQLRVCWGCRAAALPALPGLPRAPTEPGPVPEQPPPGRGASPLPERVAPNSLQCDPTCGLSGASGPGLQLPCGTKHICPQADALRWGHSGLCSSVKSHLSGATPCPPPKWSQSTEAAGAHPGWCRRPTWLASRSVSALRSPRGVRAPSRGPPAGSAVGDLRTRLVIRSLLHTPSPPLLTGEHARYLPPLQRPRSPPTLQQAPRRAVPGRAHCVGDAQGLRKTAVPL